MRPGILTATTALLFWLSPVWAGAGWLTYQCTWVDSAYHDGDSFHAKANTGYEYIFRLYAVDCPETDLKYRSRTRAQAAHFRVTEDELIQWGEKAKAFTRRFLKGGFTVHTRKEDARGSSRKKRYYAVVLVGGKDLAEALVSEGLARAYGLIPDWPPDQKRAEDRYRKRLSRLEAQARVDRKGLWSISRR